jgi:hypothetical protein
MLHDLDQRSALGLWRPRRPTKLTGLELGRNVEHRILETKHLLSPLDATC